MRPTSTPLRKMISDDSPVAGVAGAAVCADPSGAVPIASRATAVQWRMESITPQISSSAAMFSPEQYRALHETAGLVNRAGRGQLSFDGGDRLAFLQGLLTNDIQALEPGTGCYAALLTANGRMVADMRVLDLGDATIVDVDASLAVGLRDRFDQFIFSEDVRVEDVSAAVRELGVYGPLAARVIGAILPAATDSAALSTMPLHSNRRFETERGAVVVVRSDDVGVEGFDLVVDASQSESTAAALRSAGAAHIDAETVEVTRIEAGRPKFGVDMSEDTIPLEAGIEDRAISLTKGCYVGQEVIIRVLHRGHGRVARRLVGIRLEQSGAVPSRGAIVNTGDREVGRITSAVYSPSVGAPIALGYVRREFTEPGTALTVGGASGGQPGTVVQLPFV
jgi:folate-binding protein YgfZ